MHTEITDEKSNFTQSVENVLKETSDLHNALQSLTSTNSSLRFYCKKLLGKIGAFNKDFAKMSQLCNICFESDRRHCLVPCGHLMCLSCCERCISNEACFICRAKPDAFMKIFG